MEEELMAYLLNIDADEGFDDLVEFFEKEFGINANAEFFEKEFGMTELTGNYEQFREGAGVNELTDNGIDND